MTSADELKDQGVKLFQQYDYEAAAKVFEQAREGYASSGDDVQAAEMMVNIGLVHRALNEGQQALDVMQEALQIFQQANHKLYMAQTLGNMGGVFAKMDDKEQAYNCYRRAADLFDELGEKKMYGETMIAIGALQVKEGKFMAGAGTYEVGLENLDQLNANQRMLKGLLGIKNRFLGGGSQADDSVDKPDDKDS